MFIRSYDFGSLCADLNVITLESIDGLNFLMRITNQTSFLFIFHIENLSWNLHSKDLVCRGTNFLIWVSCWFHIQVSFNFPPRSIDLQWFKPSLGIKGFVVSIVSIYFFKINICVKPTYLPPSILTFSFKNSCRWWFLNCFHNKNLENPIPHSLQRKNMGFFNAHDWGNQTLGIHIATQFMGQFCFV